MQRYDIRSFSDLSGTSKTSTKSILQLHFCLFPLLAVFEFTVSKIHSNPRLNLHRLINMHREQETVSMFQRKVGYIQPEGNHVHLIFVSFYVLENIIQFCWSLRLFSVAKRFQRDLIRFNTTAKRNNCLENLTFFYLSVLFMPLVWKKFRSNCNYDF